jgi:hypothetical protein
LELLAQRDIRLNAASEKGSLPLLITREIRIFLLIIVYSLCIVEQSLLKEISRAFKTSMVNNVPVFGSKFLLQHLMIFQDF